MSEASLRSIQERLDRLHTYIDLNADNFFPIDFFSLGTWHKTKAGGGQGVKIRIREVCRMFPNGRHHDHIVRDLKNYLPETIDIKLKELKQECSIFIDPYGSHITSEIDGILSQLQSFRSSHGWVTALVGDQHARMPALAEMRALLGRLAPK